MEREPSVTKAMIRAARGSGAAMTQTPAITPFELGQRVSAMATHLPETVSKWDALFL
jgi:hypothetical protein